MYYRPKNTEPTLGCPKPEPKVKVKKVLKSKTKPLTLVEKLDRVFSQWNRKNAADESGSVKCYTCTAVLNWRKMENGHFISRKHMATRWHISNNHPQCTICNREKAGNLKVYAENLQKEYGKDILLELAVLSTQSVKFSRPELEEMIFEYKEKLNQLA